MLYLDGELARDEGREVERALEADPQAQTRLEALIQMREAVQARFELAMTDAEPQLEAMWDKLRTELRPAPSRAPPRFWQSMREWFERYRSHMMTGAVAAAAGAIIATVATSGHGPSPVRAARPALAAEVESLEVPDGSAMVFQIPPEAAGEAPTTVIWVNEDTEAQREGPIRRGWPAWPWGSWRSRQGQSGRARRGAHRRRGRRRRPAR
jgi:anti-sigma factor RsiW